MPFLYILRFQCSDINTRLRTENFSHQFGLPRKSGTSYTNSISSISSGKRRPRQKSRGLSHYHINSPSIASTIETPNVQIESSPAKSLTKEETKSNDDELDYKLSPALTDTLNPPLSTPQHFFPVSTTTEVDDLLENNPPRPSRLMSRRESLASTRSYYDSYIPNLSAEYSRSPQPTSTSDPTNLRTWTKARDFKPTQIPPERFRRCSAMLNGVKSDFSAEQISLL
ncbi:unnamed protein product [Rodentolepis nana]|uniref:Uncharacterized protein n=1 Tax=Rodentolepis nana TaxID=102285 RepID=A0A0R3TBE3_RODNA|nr:unnamed protein product [Rodentolepis nana]